MANVSEYGEWKSPISSKLVSESSVKFQEVHVDKGSEGYADIVYWSELRFDEGGRYVICSKKEDQADYTSWTPEGFNARNRVHEYGGGAFFVNNGTVYFSNFSDQRMYAQASPESKPEAITPADCGWRFADGTFSTKLGRIFCVREDHGVVERKEAKEAQNTIVVINPTNQQQNILASGCDFYSTPRVSPDGSKIAWVQWNHPNMPWDSTEIWVADVDSSGDSLVPGSSKKIAGGNENSVMLPSWTSDNELLYVGDQSDWWNLYHVTKSGDHVNLREVEKECGMPNWIFGWQTYDQDPSGNGDIAVLYAGELGILNLRTREYRTVETGFKSHEFLAFQGNQKICGVGGSPTQFPCVISVNTNSGNTEVLRESKKVAIDKEYFSIPTEIKWPTANDAISYGYFYPPKNKDFTGPEDSLPPLLVRVHGGPTSRCSSNLSLTYQYFTTRGFAVLDVNYRGSTGYGKQYRNALRMNWGITDVEDCCSGAQFLADQKKVDPARLCIDGGSAGGYTTLACLAFQDVFKAGASHYGVADCEALAADTHKFESRYLDNLIGPYPQAKATYQERSPIHHIKNFNCPLALFQGDEDKIVPPNQAEMMYNAIKEKGLPTVYVLFQGEQHGFRKAENVQKALDGEFNFYSQVFGFQAADTHYQLDVVNLKK
ncbi:unnamed protein product [Owenia fusiformis]|uniref:Uncharacterized protein n=1 Tax=Owenia fusiformis TaxID=6347 RepID=A0A8J1U318_OWEFU|nr:unnamed protein product [Owenia fusiformis]